MTHDYDEPLVSRKVSMRYGEQRKLKIHQQKEMDNRRVAAQSSAFNQSVSATTDRYMRDALSQVRKSDVTLPETLTRHNGTWVHNQK
jgi:hypothetical protein